MIDFYKLSIETYKRVLGASIVVLEKGAQHCHENNLNSDDVLNACLADDMWGLSKQVNSIRHHSLGSINGIQQGQFSPPPAYEPDNYDALIAHLQSAISELEQYDRETVNGWVDNDVLFKAGSFELPFKAVNFVNSFSLPNLYFHATTTYDILRAQGVSLSKVDYIGAIDTGLS